MTWKLQVDQAGDYEVALNHAAEPGAVGQHVQISGSGRVEYTIAKTKGVFGDKSCEMTPIKDRLRLEAGPSRSRLASRTRRKRWLCSSFAVSELDSRRRQRGHRSRATGERGGRRASTEWLAEKLSATG